jgi:hypothetical protein
MPVVTLSAFFKDDDGHGWMESHDKDGGGGVIALTTYLAAFHALMQGPRRNLLGGDAFYLGCRASYPTATGAIASDNILMDPPMRGVQTFMSNIVNMGPPSAAIKMRFRNEASTAKSDAYIRGQWRQTVDAGVLDFVSAIGAEWKSRADIYGAALITNGYGWEGVNPALTSRGEVTGYTANPDGTITLNVAPLNGVAMPVAGTRVAMKFARINGSKSVLNRALTCVVEPGAAAVTTTVPIAASDFETNGTFIASVTGFIPYAALTYYRLSGRKTGRPFGVGPGRLSAQTLH